MKLLREAAKANIDKIETVMIRCSTVEGRYHNNQFRYYIKDGGPEAHVPVITFGIYNGSHPERDAIAAKALPMMNNDFTFNDYVLRQFHTEESDIVAADMLLTGQMVDGKLNVHKKEIFGIRDEDNFSAHDFSPTDIANTLFRELLDDASYDNRIAADVKEAEIADVLDEARVINRNLIHMGAPYRRYLFELNSEMGRISEIDDTTLLFMPN